jgi:2'-5' RNA ligase
LDAAIADLGKKIEIVDACVVDIVCGEPARPDRMPMLEQFSLSGFDAIPKPTDRLFFAIFPDAAAAARIARLAQRLRSEHGLEASPLGTERFHITLHHLGDYAGLPQGVVADAIRAAATIAMPQFEVTFDRALSFHGRSGNRPLVLRGCDGLVTLEAFHGVLGAALYKAGLTGGRARSRYIPHVTLLYDDFLILERPIETVTWTVRDFVLVHSLLGRTVHLPLARWPLSA